jgi:hypothetical protein
MEHQKTSLLLQQHCDGLQSIQLHNRSKQIASKYLCHVIDHVIFIFIGAVGTLYQDGWDVQQAMKASTSNSIVQ